MSNLSLKNKHAARNAPSSTFQVKANSVLFDLTLKRYPYVNSLQVGVPEMKSGTTMIKNNGYLYFYKQQNVKLKDNVYDHDYHLLLGDDDEDALLPVLLVGVE